MIKTPRRSHQDQGFTLTELMVVVVILALLAAIAVPALTKDDEEERFEQFVSTFMRDLQRQRYAAISSKEDRALAISGSSYQLVTLVNGVYTDMEVREAKVDCFVADVTAISAMPGNSYSTPSLTPLGGTRYVVFQGQGGSQLDLTGSDPLSQPATIFFGTRSGNHKKRIVVFPATSYAALYQDW